MGPLDTAWHLLNFIAPAAAVAVLVAFLGRVFASKNPPRYGFMGFVAINFIVGCVALLGALVAFGVDGKMLAYLALVLAVASSQWALSPRG